MEPERRNKRFELYESIILSIAILGTAWSAYQAALWNGIQTFRLAEVAASSRAAMGKALVYRAVIYSWMEFKFCTLLTISSKAGQRSSSFTSAESGLSCAPPWRLG